MFGNDWQPGTYDFKLGVEKEIRYQVERLRNHPSIVLWSGNNETEAAFNWNQNGGQSPEVRMRMWQDYLTLFSGAIASTVAATDPDRPYWPSSPSADYEETSPEYQSGDYHEWIVWHGRADFSEYETHFNRFISEFGFQSFPEMRTAEAFTSPEDRTSIFTPVMLAHQKNKAGNSIIHDYMTRYFGEPKDFASFLYASQVLQAEGIKVGAEHLRRIRPRNMGSIFWQLNDCWPVASWSSLDYYGRWKALQYYARRFYAPLLVSPHVEDGSLSVYIVSDKTSATPAQIRVRIMRFNGNVLREETRSTEIPALSSSKVITIPISSLIADKAFDPATSVAVVDLLVDGKRASSNLAFFAASRDLQLPHPEIAADLVPAGDRYMVTLRSPVLARSVYVSFDGVDAEFSDNYLDIVPGQPVTIEIRSSASPDELKAKLRLETLADAFAPRNSQQGLSTAK